MEQKSLISFKLEMKRFKNDVLYIIDFKYKQK